MKLYILNRKFISQNKKRRCLSMRRNELSECELIVMKCVWDGNGDITCAEVIEKLKTKYGLDYAETTVYTFLKNLKNKGFIETYKNRITRFKPIR